MKEFDKPMLNLYRCNRCGHPWASEQDVEKIKVCPKCKNPYWNSPRRGEKKDSEA